MKEEHEEGCGGCPRGHAARRLRPETRRQRREMPEFDDEGHVACYDVNGKFKKYDDDCEDDGLYTWRNLPKRATSSPVKPVVKRSPMPLRSRR